MITYRTMTENQKSIARMFAEGIALRGRCIDRYCAGDPNKVVPDDESMIEQLDELITQAKQMREFVAEKTGAQ